MTEFTEKVDDTLSRPPTSEQLIADDSDLLAAIGGLSELVTDSFGLGELLAEVATFVRCARYRARTVPG